MTPETIHQSEHTRRIDPSGLYYPNKIARTYLLSIEELIGKADVARLLRDAGLERYVDNYPPDNFERKFDFADFAAISAGLETIHGFVEAQDLSYKAGYGCFQYGMKGFGALAGLGSFSLGFRGLLVPARIKLGLLGMATIFSTFTDQLTQVEEFPDRFTYTIKKCPMCLSRHSDEPICHGALGLIDAGLRWVSDGQTFNIVETRCCAMGHDGCVIQIDKQPRA